MHVPCNGAYNLLLGDCIIFVNLNEFTSNLESNKYNPAWIIDKSTLEKIEEKICQTNQKSSCTCT